jgi:mRNA interferase MazF
MARTLTGEVSWVNPDPTRGHEQSGQGPVLVLCQDVFNEQLGVGIAVALTSQPQKAAFPLTLALDILRLPKRLDREDSVLGLPLGSRGDAIAAT